MQKLSSNKLKGLLKEYEITQQKLADMLQLTITTVNKRIKNVELFTIRDLLILADYINIKIEQLISRLIIEEPHRSDFN